MNITVLYYAIEIMINTCMLANIRNETESRFKYVETDKGNFVLSHDEKLRDELKILFDSPPKTFKVTDLSCL